MGKSIGIDDEHYAKLEEMNEETGLGMQGTLRVILDHVLPRIELRTETRVIFNEEVVVERVADEAFARSVEEVRQTVAPKGKPPKGRVVRQVALSVDTNTLTGRIRHVFNNNGSEMNAPELRAALQEAFPGAAVPGNLHSILKNMPDIQQDSDRIPHVFSLRT